MGRIHPLINQHKIERSSGCPAGQTKGRILSQKGNFTFVLNILSVSGFPPFWQQFRRAFTLVSHCYSWHGTGGIASGYDITSFAIQAFNNLHHVLLYLPLHLQSSYKSTVYTVSCLRFLHDANPLSCRV